MKLYKQHENVQQLLAYSIYIKWLNLSHNTKAVHIQ